ncbi:MAG: response regulator transcription factor [Candidatus Tyrphobacter sp.]
MKPILIFERVGSLALGLAQLLRDGGFDARIVSSPEVALELLADRAVRILVISECRCFNSAPMVRRSYEMRIPTIVLGTTDSSKGRMAAFALGADCYLAKPYSPREVLARARSLVRPLAQAQGP